MRQGDVKAVLWTGVPTKRLMTYVLRGGLICGWTGVD